MKRKNWFKSLLEKIANENEKEFGDKKIGCCDLNKGKKGEKN